MLFTSYDFLLNYNNFLKFLFYFSFSRIWYFIMFICFLLTLLTTDVSGLNNDWLIIADCITNLHVFISNLTKNFIKPKKVYAHSVQFWWHLSPVLNQYQCHNIKPSSPAIYQKSTLAVTFSFSSIVLGNSEWTSTVTFCQLLGSTQMMQSNKGRNDTLPQ